MSGTRDLQLGIGESSPGGKNCTRATFRPPSDFRLNVESGLRTALSTGFAFLWMGRGPFQGGLSFFAGVTAIVSLGNSAGETVDRSLQMTHGAVIGCICAFLSRWLIDSGPVWGGAGFFLSIFLVVRSRRLTSLGKKFGALAVTILTIAQSDKEFPSSWVESGVVVWLRTHVEGGIFAVAACLLPYPKFATRNGVLRAQFVCQSLSEAVRACVKDFKKGRDESSISRARLLCEQVRHNLGLVRKELEWSRLELGLLCCGCFVGGMRTADALEELAEILDQVLRGVRGMRQSMSRLVRSRAQRSFATALTPSLEEVAEAVDDVLLSMPCGYWMPRAPRLEIGNAWPFKRLRRKLPPTSTPGGAGSVECGLDRRYSASHHGAAVADAQSTHTSASNRSTSHVNASDSGSIEKAASNPKRNSNPNPNPGAPALDSRGKAVARLNLAVAVMMTDYNNARKSILYGLDEHCRPLEDSSRLSRSTSRTVTMSAKPGAEQQLQKEAEAGGGRENAGDGSSLVEEESLPETSSQSRAGVSFQDLAALTRRPMPSSTSPPPRLSSGRGDRESYSPLLKDGRGGNEDEDDVWGGGGNVDYSEDEGVPNHVLVMRERVKLGSAATMARGAFIFCLAGLCGTLTEETNNSNWRRRRDPVAAVEFFLDGLWIGLRPPPGMLTLIFLTGRYLSKNITRLFRRGWSHCFCYGRVQKDDRSCLETTLEPPEARRADDPEGGGVRGVVGGIGEGRSSSLSWCAEGRRLLLVCAKSDTLWAFKVSLTVTLCAIFAISGYLSDIFRPAVWIPVTAAFLMADKDSSAASTCLLRLVGTVLGAVYGILAVKLLGSSQDDPYSWQAHAIILPWVAITCFFRNSSSFAYAALVAAFTAVVMFTGASTVLGADGEAVSLARITNTVIGICIYLTVDTLLVPTRAKDLVKEEVYKALDAALHEVCTNGQRLFSSRVCPRDSRPPFPISLNSAPSDAGGATVDVHGTPPPELSQASSDNASAVPMAATQDPQPPLSLRHRYPHRRPVGDRSCSDVGSCGRRHDPVVPPRSGCSSRHVRHRRSSSDGREIWGGANLQARSGSSSRRGRVRSSSSDEGEVWGDTNLQGVRVGCNVGGKCDEFEDKSGPMVAGKGEARTARSRLRVTPGDEDLQTGNIKDGGGTSDAAEMSEVALDDEEEDLEGGKGGRLCATGDTVVSGLSMKLTDESLQELVAGLARQKHYILLAELEPQLWFEPFPSEAYHGMIAAQEELLRALSLMSRASIAIAQDRSRDWRVELGVLGAHLATLVQLLKVGLENARDVFRVDGDDPNWRNGWQVSKMHEVHLLELQAEANRLDSVVNTDFVGYIQAFLERGTFPDLELESILRINTAIFAVMGLQRALLTLGHAVATVVDRESFHFYYR